MPRRLQSRFLAAFALAIASFVTSTIYSAHLSRRIDERASSIAVELMPSIERLSETRNRLRALAVAVARDQAATDAASRAAVVDARDQVDDAFERHLAVPASHVGEQTQWAEIQRSLVAVSHAIDEDLRASSSSPGVASRAHRAIDAAARSIGKVIALDVEHARELAVEIEGDRRWATRVALLLDLASAVFTAIAAMLALRALRHHQQIVEERNALLARRADELEQFASRVAHDIVGPLSVTRLAIESASMRATEPALTTLERGRRGVDRVNGIVDGLLRFARAGARPEPGASASVMPVVEGVCAELEPVARQAGAIIGVEARANVAVAAHAGVLASVVENLVGNAIKYIGDRAAPRVRVRVSAKPGVVRIEVEDNGPGIDPTIVDTLFDPHVRGRDRTKPGFGLGLATVKRVIDAHGGTCGVVSQPGSGSVFWIELPAAHAARTVEKRTA